MVIRNSTVYVKMASYIYHVLHK